MSLTIIATLLQTALMLLTAAQSPNVTQSLHDQAVQVADQAISLATAALSESMTDNNVSEPIAVTKSNSGKSGGSTDTATINISATPVSGPAPLTVSFSGWASINEENYSVDFGDGTGSGLGGDCAADIPTGCGISHTYTSPGTYVARLTAAVDACNKGAGGLNQCLVPNNTPTISSVTITVDDP